MKVNCKASWYSEHFKYFLSSKERYQILFGGRGCFGGGQLIETKQGLKPISKIKVGDTVLSANLTENKQEFKEVVNVFEYENSDKCIKINYDNKEIICTLEHKFYHNGEFKPIEKILKENIPTLKNQYLTSFDISKIKSVEYLECSKVYDIEVEQNHNYYLENNILVHNSGKTHHIILKLILLSFLQEYNHIIYVNKIFGDIRKNQFKDIIKVLKALELSKYFTINKTNYGFKNNLTGTEFTALGMDNAENTKGLSDPTIIWWDEINKGSQEDFTTLNALLRTPLNNKLQFIISFNPVSESSWLRKYFFSQENAYKLKPEIENAYINHSTYLDNDFIDKDAYIKTLEINALGNVNRMLVDIKGLWGTILNNNPFFYALNRSKHYLPNYDFKVSDAYVDLSFDFNKTPSTIVCGQVQKDGFYIFDCLFGDVNTFVGKSALEAVCTMFKNKYPQIQSYKIRVTGDASGRSGTADNKLNVNYYTTIKKELRLYDNQIDPFVRKANLAHGLSGLIINTFLTEVPIYFVGDALILLDEMERAESDEKQTLNTWKKDTAKSGGGHAVDSARYLITDLWINSNEKLWREKITQISRSFIK